MQILRLWPQRQIQLSRHESTSQESCRFASRVAETMFFGFDGASTCRANSDCNTRMPFGRLSASRHQAVQLCDGPNAVDDANCLHGEASAASRQTDDDGRFFAARFWPRSPLRKLRCRWRKTSIRCFVFYRASFSAQRTRRHSEPAPRRRLPRHRSIRGVFGAQEQGELVNESATQR